MRETPKTLLALFYNRIKKNEEDITMDNSQEITLSKSYRSSETIRGATFSAGHGRSPCPAEKVEYIVRPYGNEKE
jgi:hypothetical protein